MSIEPEICEECGEEIYPRDFCLCTGRPERSLPQGQAPFWQPDFEPKKVGDVGIDRNGEWWIMLPGPAFQNCTPKHVSYESKPDLEAEALGLFDVASYDDYFVESGPAVPGAEGKCPQ